MGFSRFKLERGVCNQLNHSVFIYLEKNGLEYIERKLPFDTVTFYPSVRAPFLTPLVCIFIIHLLNSKSSDMPYVWFC